MLYPSINEIRKKADSRYTLVILAAKRAGINTIVLSAENEKDIKDIKEIYVKGLEFHYVKTMQDVIEFIF